VPFFAPKHNPMATTHKDLFYSKVMLFGEYSIILGSNGLTIPFSHFNGQLSFVNQNSYTDLDFAKASNRQLKDYVDYLAGDKDGLHQLIDTDRLRTDVNNGLYFESSIPESYGLGSSGALVAAIYSKYAKQRMEADALMGQSDLLLLKRNFAKLESYFHGTSSGIDPLICYLNHPLCIENGHSILAVTLPLQQIANNDAIFIVNTGKPGKTAPLVGSFMKRLEEPAFNNMVNHELIPITNGCIGHLIAGEIPALFNQLKVLSKLQLAHFEAMIPKAIQPIWEQGLDNDLFTMKLCGSGGGGYALGFTHHFDETREFFKKRQIEIIPVFQVKSTGKSEF
jgi:mevalonate kinase